MLCGVNLHFYEQLTWKSATYLSCRREEGAEIDPCGMLKRNGCGSWTLVSHKYSDHCPGLGSPPSVCSYDSTLFLSEFTPGFKARLSFLTELRGFAYACLQEISEKVVLSSICAIQAIPMIRSVVTPHSVNTDKFIVVLVLKKHFSNKTQQTQSKNKDHVLRCKSVMALLN